MNDKHRDDLSPSERLALASLSHSSMPPGDLEGRTVAALEQRGLIRKRKGGILMKLSLTAAALATVIVAFMAGVTVGKKDQAATEPTADKQFMLLLFSNHTAESPALDSAMGEEELAAIIDEYRQWGVRLRDEGRLVGAEKLKDDVFILAAGQPQRTTLPEGRVLGGYFLIRANDIEQAREIALTHPHLKYGGEIEIRPLDLHD